MESPAGAGPHQLRIMNRAVVLGAIRRAGTARVTELVEATGLSRPTVAGAVSTLLDDGWVEELGPPEPGGRLGRPARVLRFRANARHVLGVDVGPHKVYGVVADLDGTVVGRARRDIAELRSHVDLLRHVDQVVAEALEAAAVPASSLVTVGVGTPGIVDEDGTVVQAPSLPGWSRLALGSWLGRSIACPVFVENDVNLAVLAERSVGIGRDADSMVLVQWGARVGAAVLVHGRVHRGAHGAAGEIGFVDLEAEPTGVQPQGLGPLEASVGTDWILHQARKLGARNGQTAADVLAAAADRDPIALEVVDEACARFARGLAPFLAAIDPELVVLGGVVTLAGDAVLSSVRRHLARRALVVPRIELSALGDDAVALGAVRLALDQVELQLPEIETAAPL